MTTEELCNLISQQISQSFNLSKELIQEQLFKGATEDMTEQEVYAHMFLQSIIISANLSAQVVISTLVEMNVISPDLLSSLKMKPQLHLVTPAMANDIPSSENHEEGPRYTSKYCQCFEVFLFSGLIQLDEKNLAKIALTLLEKNQP